MNGGASIGERRDEPNLLAKEWLLRLIEGTPLDQAEDIPIAWIAGEAPALIADIAAALEDPEAEDAKALTSARGRVSELARRQDRPDGAERIPRDLASLQTLLVDAIRRQTPERRLGDFAQSVVRLAEVFGSIQAAVASELVEGRAGGRVDEVTGLPGAVQLEEWLGKLLEDHQRYEQGFAVAVIDIDGLAKVNEAYGRDAGDRMLTAVAGVVTRQIGAADRAFRLSDDELGIVAPRQEAADVAPIAERIAALVADSQSAEGPRIGIAIGIAACPADGESPEELFEAAQQATYAAKAAGQPVAVSPGGAPIVVQDR